MPNKNTQNENDDKNYHAKRKRVDKEILRLVNRLNELRPKGKSIQSQQNKDEISKLERENIEKVMELMRMDGSWKREIKRREHCKIPSNKCPICPLRPASQ